MLHDNVARKTMRYRSECGGSSAADASVRIYNRRPNDNEVYGNSACPRIFFDDGFSGSLAMPNQAKRNDGQAQCVDRQPIGLAAWKRLCE